METYLGFFHADLFLKFAVALVALLNPLYGIPIFLGMTKGYTQKQRSRTANIIVLTVFVAAVVVTLIGEEILGFFGIDVAAFQIAGGIIVLGDRPFDAQRQSDAGGRRQGQGCSR